MQREVSCQIRIRLLSRPGHSRQRTYLESAVLTPFSCVFVNLTFLLIGTLQNGPTTVDSSPTVLNRFTLMFLCLRSLKVRTDFSTLSLGNRKLLVCSSFRQVI